MSIKIKCTGEGGQVEIDVKRFYIPYVVTAPCPKCKKATSTDLNSDYLSYPTANALVGITMYCAACEHGWEEECFLRVSLEKP